MLPETVICEDCGRNARVRACGRIEYDWPNPAIGGQVATMPTINSARLTIDCPRCGVKTQDFRPEDAADTAPGQSAAGGPATIQVPRRPFIIRPRHPK